MPHEQPVPALQICVLGAMGKKCPADRPGAAAMTDRKPPTIDDVLQALQTIQDFIDYVNCVFGATQPAPLPPPRKPWAKIIDYIISNGPVSYDQIEDFCQTNGIKTNYKTLIAGVNYNARKGVIRRLKPGVYAAPQNVTRIRNGTES